MDIPDVAEADGTGPDDATPSTGNLTPRTVHGAEGSADGEAGTADAEASTTGTPAEPGQASAGQASARKRRSRGKFYRELAIIVVAALVLTVLVKAFVVQVYKIPSGSMQNTLLPGDRVLVNKLVYRFRGIDRGDIVVFNGSGSWGNLEGQPTSSAPSNPVARIFDDALSAVGLRTDSTFYIKRVIGLPGDHVACCTSAGQVTVNAVALHETGYLYPGATTSTFSTTVPAGQLFVMGDWRTNSSDSRVNGPIPESSVVGRAFLVIWPLSRFGDLPIPDTFKQAAINTAPAAAAGLIATPVLLWRRRRRRTP
jgi:signal peptidase I